MRTLTKNKTKLWLVKETGYVDAVDLNGNYTGDKVKIYGTPTEILLSIYPNNGDLKQVAGGILAEFDYIAVSELPVLSGSDILFTSLPVSNYGTTYSYRVDKVMTSINVNFYGLKARV